MVDIDKIIDRLKRARKLLTEEAQGRSFDVGTLVLYRGKLGVVVDLNKDAEDPAGTTVDIRLEDGTVIEKVKVTSKSLKFFRA